MDWCKACELKRAIWVSTIWVSVGQFSPILTSFIKCYKSLSTTLAQSSFQSPQQRMSTFLIEIFFEFWQSQSSNLTFRVKLLHLIRTSQTSLSVKSVVTVWQRRRRWFGINWCILINVIGFARFVRRSLNITTVQLTMAFTSIMSELRQLDLKVPRAIRKKVRKIQKKLMWKNASTTIWSTKLVPLTSTTKTAVR